MLANHSCCLPKRMKIKLQVERLYEDKNQHFAASCKGIVKSRHEDKDKHFPAPCEGIVKFRLQFNFPLKCDFKTGEEKKTFSRFKKDEDKNKHCPALDQ